MDRGRLVLTDIIYILVALLALAAFWPVLNELLVNATGMQPGVQLVFTTMLPLATMVLLAIIFVEARSGL